MICFYFFQETDHTIFIFDYQLYFLWCQIHSQHKYIEKKKKKNQIYAHVVKINLKKKKRKEYMNVSGE